MRQQGSGGSSSGGVDGSGEAMVGEEAAGVEVTGQEDSGLWGGATDGRWRQQGKVVSLCFYGIY